ncbi:MAG: 2-C-methyl-D-erythritol 4-phosphate cytidylyltransferase [Bacillota bacterium]|nr:2-C-methyl-D-erythritol 4-phosphate cytidylyltransferase [Bacillota bacterium]
MKYSLIVLAAGRGSRTKLEYNKVFYTLSDGQTVLEKSLSLFVKDPDCAQIVVVCASGEEELMAPYCKDEKIEITVGGATRQDSVYNGLQKVKSDYVFIHDGARPFLEQEQIDALKSTLETEKACLLMIPSVDTVKVVENGYVKCTLERATLFNAQTPQCFETKLILSCHEQAKKENFLGTDDASLVEVFSQVPIKMVESSAANKKITNPSDL